MSLNNNTDPETSACQGAAKVPRCLSDCQIPGPPPTMYYLADFISAEEEQALMSKVNSAPQPQWRVLAHRRLQSLPSPLSASNVLLDVAMPKWLEMPVQRLIGVPIESTEGSQDQHLSEAEGPKSVEHVFAKSPHGRPNHCLVNEYLPGQGILPHEDGPAYYPITATVSLGSHAVLNVRAKTRGDESSAQDEESAWRILCEPRSLLLTTGQAYMDTLHGIQEIEGDEDLGPEPAPGIGKGIANWDLLSEHSCWSQENGRARRGTRISLTYRDVLKVKSIKGIGFLKREGR